MEEIEEVDKEYADFFYDQTKNYGSENVKIKSPD